MMPDPSVGFRGSFAPALPLSHAAPLAGTAVLHSFDVFDTLITRNLWRPEDLFLLLGLRLRESGLVQVTPESFAARRAEAEAMLRAIPGVEEVDLVAIHRALAPAHGWTDDQARAAAALEVATEEAAIRPIAANVSLLAQLRATGADTVLVSDTYLDRSALQTLLRAGGIEAAPERVFASAAHGASKRTGRLFTAVAAATGVPADRMVHLGDHPRSDVAVPRLMGIRAHPSHIGEPTRHERALHDATSAHPPLLRSLLAGSARAARLSAAPATAHERALWNVGATVAGPLLAGFALWILQRARATGATRIHFVARDGQILLRMSQILQARLGWNIECRYLYGSRQAWHLPALERLDPPALAWLADAGPYDPLRSVLARAELAPARIEAALARHGLLGEEALGRPAAPDRIRALLRDPDVEPLILAAAAGRRATALGYLRQEGVLGAGSALMVDLGWHGRLQRSLQRLVDLGTGAAPPTRVSGLYFALRSRPDDMPPERMRTFITAPDALQRLNPVLLEMFCAADHGTVRRYTRTAEGGYGPELAAAVDEPVMAWGLGTLQGGMLAFTRELAAAMEAAGEVDPESWIAVLRDGGLAAYQGFRREPDPEEAEAFGAFPHADGQSHESAMDCAPRIGALTRLRLGLGVGDAGYAGHWPEASLQRGGGRLGAALFAVRRLRRRLKNRLRG